MRVIFSALCVASALLVSGCTTPQVLASESGIQGEPGIQGEQGVQGEQGIVGEPGLPGPAGIRGLQGLQGLQGVAGVDGVDGVDGEDGAAGLQGPQGIQGPQGLQGVAGPPGPAGTATAYKVFNNYAQTAPSAGWAHSFALKTGLPAGSYAVTFNGYVTSGIAECTFEAGAFSKGDQISGATTGNTLGLNAVVTLTSIGSNNYVNTWCRGVGGSAQIDDAALTLLPIGTVL